MEFKTAKCLKYAKNPKITTDITEIDAHLQGGVGTGKVFELVGKPGTGKTQMCMKLCLNAQIPRNANGMVAKSLYFDTRKDFNPTRLKELAEDLERRLRLRCESRPAPQANEMLQNVFYVDCGNAAQLAAGLLSCHKYLKEEPNIKLIVVDSMAFAIRMMDDVSERTELLMELHFSMRQLQREHDVAFVITNDLGYQLQKSRFQLEPVLGLKHAHLINERIWLTKNDCFIGKTFKTKRWICKLSNWI